MANKIVKKSVGPHFGSIQNNKTFYQAYDHIKAFQDNQYLVMGNCTPFICKAYVASKGIHKGQKVITFSKVGSTKISAYAYFDCWGKKTNCYGSYIDCYSPAI